jgi:hypothetical protein
MHSTVLECCRQCWNAADSVGKNLYRVGIPLYRVGMVSRLLECFLEGWNDFDRVGIPL